jgi:DNA polymerase-3 subunit gamma/tau
MRVLSRTWQMLLKGLAEVQQAGRPIAASEMVLVRIAYAADLPTPDEVIRSLGDETASAAPRPQGNGGGAMATQTGLANAPRVEAPRGAPRAAAAPAFSPVARLAETAPQAAQPNALVVGSFEQLVALAIEKRDLQIKAALERDVRLVRCEDGRLEIALEPSAPKTLVNELSRKISARAGRRDFAGAGRSARRRAETRRARRSAGAGGVREIPRRRDRVRAQPGGGCRAGYADRHASRR